MPFEAMDDERACRIALHHTAGLGPRTARRLIERLGSAQAVFRRSDRDLEAHGVSAMTVERLRTPNWGAVAAALDWAARDDHHLLVWGDNGYPALLREIHDPPLMLFIHGDPRVLSRPQLAVVGSRNASHVGERDAYDLSMHLAQTGLAITSGLALGIDGAAHRGALAGGGATIAVAGTGIDQIYPPAHRELAARIVSSGALLSELPLGTPPRAQNFPRRNRIISGLAQGTLVVEAGLQSGSLLTARHALDQGREVFAVPGSIHNPMAQGCHALIREGAKLVEGVEDVLEELAPGGAVPGTLGGPEVAGRAEAGPLDPDYVRLLGCMGTEPVGIDFLVECSALTAPTVSSMLLILELEGYVRSQVGGLYIRQRTPTTS